MDWGKWRDATKPLSINIGGQALNIEYRPMRLSRATIEKLEAAEAEAKAAPKKPARGAAKKDSEIEAVTLLVGTMQQEVISQVISWSLTDKGEPIPLTMEAFAAYDIDIEFCTLILAAIKANEANGTQAPATTSAASVPDEAPAGEMSTQVDAATE